MARELKLGLRVTAQTREAMQRLAGLGNRLGAVGRGAGGAFRGLNTALEKTTGALTSIRGLAVGFGVFAGLRGITGATIKQEEALAQIEARLRSTGRTSQITTAQIAGIAGELQKATGIGDEEILDAQAKLLSFTNVAVDQLPRSTEVILDIATAMGVDLRSAAIQLGKALDDPERGLDGLSRAGTTFSKEQKDTIRALYEQGRAAEAQALILENVEKQTGGTARTLRDTLGGSLKAAGSAFGDLWENADESGALRDSVERLVTLLTDPNTRQGVQAFTTLLIDGLATAAGLVTDISNGLRHLFGDSTAEQDVAELLDLRDDGWLSRVRVGGDEGWFGHLSDEDIDRMLGERLEAVRDANRTISRAMAESIRQSGAEIDEELLKAVTAPARGRATVPAEVHHEGGIAGDGRVMRALPAALYGAGGPLLGRDEVPAVLRRGEIVLTPEQATALEPLRAMEDRAAFDSEVLTPTIFDVLGDRKPEHDLAWVVRQVGHDLEDQGFQIPDNLADIVAKEVAAQAWAALEPLRAMGDRAAFDSEVLTPTIFDVLDDRKPEHDLAWVVRQVGHDLEDQGFQIPDNLADIVAKEVAAQAWAALEPLRAMGDRAAFDSEVLTPTIFDVLGDRKPEHDLAWVVRQVGHDLEDQGFQIPDNLAEVVAKEAAAQATFRDADLRGQYGGSLAARVPTLTERAGQEAADVRVGGSIRVGFEEAPPGMRVRDVRSDNPDVDIEVEAGYAMAGS